MLADAVAAANPSRAAEAATFIFSMLYIKFDKGPLSRRLGLVFLLALIRDFSGTSSMVWVALLFVYAAFPLAVALILAVGV